MRILVSILLTSLIISCGSKTYRFDEEDFEWISYKKDDTLLFTSNTGDSDTLFIKEPKRYMEYDIDPLGPFPQDSIEKIHIPYLFSNDSTKRYGQFPGEIIIAISKSKYRTKVGFGVATNDAFFYGLRYFDIKELRKAKLINLQTNLKTYKDILMIEPDTSNQKWANRDHYVLRMYWSKSEGLVRYVKGNGVYYTLTAKQGL